MEKICKQRTTSNRRTYSPEGYDHYVALDWSMKTMAVARATKTSKKINVFEMATNLHTLKEYLATLRGRIIMTIEESSSTHWLYVELQEYVERIVICDPYKNRLLSNGPKTDKIDAIKLSELLRAGLLREVFHTLDADYTLRMIVSAYEDIIKAGVRLQNQVSALYRSQGLASPGPGAERIPKLILDQYEHGLQWYDHARTAYEAQFNEFARADIRIRNQDSIPGIGPKGAVKIVATVLDPGRFPDKGHYLAYCGLVFNAKDSGGKRYGYRLPRYSRTLKAVYKSAALSSYQKEGEFRDYYEYLRSRGTSDQAARNAVARRIATISYGIFKHGGSYKPTTRRKESTADTQTILVA